MSWEDVPLGDVLSLSPSHKRNDAGECWTGMDVAGRQVPRVAA